MNLIIEHQSPNKSIRGHLGSQVTSTLPALTVCAPLEPGKNIQKLLKPSSSGKLSQEQFQQHAAGEDEEGEEEEEEGGWTGPTASLLHISEKRRELGLQTLLG